MPILVFNGSTGKTETRYSNFVYQPVENAAGDVTGLFCEGYDVTAQREIANTLAALESELVHVSRVNAMGTMATTLAHELNQPLSAIVNYSGAMRRLVGSAKAGDNLLIVALQGIEEASQRAIEIIRNLRELTRRREPTRVAFDLKSAADECIRLVRATLKPGLQIDSAVPDGLMMNADRIQIQQVIINLLSNASDAVQTSARPHIMISVRQVDDGLVVSVIDTGSGVSAEAAESIFSWADSTKESGMGLGLSICRTILEAHHGRIWLANSGPEGSEFCFFVPAQAINLPPSTAAGERLAVET